MRDLSIVIPTYNEAGNIPLLLEKIRNAIKNEMRNLDYEVINEV